MYEKLQKSYYFKGFYPKIIHSRGQIHSIPTENI